MIEIGEFADETGIAPNLVASEVDRLIESKYIPGALPKWAENNPQRWFLGGARSLSGELAH